MLTKYTLARYRALTKRLPDTDLRNERRTPEGKDLDHELSENGKIWHF